MAGRRQQGRRVRRGRAGSRALAPGERRQLGQLGVCLALFLTLFYTKGTQSPTLLRAQAELREAITVDMDLTLAWTDLNWSLAAQRPLLESAAGLWADLFSPRTQQVGVDAAQLRTLARRELTVGGAEETTPEPTPMADSGARAEPEDAPVEPAVEEVIHVDYTGPALPEGTTKDVYPLGLVETMAPVRAVESSGFGWREHPIEGEQKFHYGVDLAVSTGTPVAAFAAGTVDYIGESDIYGLYLQLDHGNGVKSFYAHCSQLCVQQGERVELGQTVALSGATGEVTGPHLHFELKKDGVRLDPNYYIETLS